MVTIVNKGPHPSVVKEVICRNCGSTLSYTPVDLVSVTARDYGGGCDTSHHIVCPSCSNKIFVSKY
jgi:hypothetical protein